MKKIVFLTSFVLITSISTLHAQSDSFRNLRETFKEKDDVFALNVGGFFVNLVLQFADEDLNREAIRDIGTVRILTIPKIHFNDKVMSVGQYKNRLKNHDKFEELIHVKDQGDDITIFMRSAGRNRNEYQIVVDNGTEVTALEFKGYIDVTAFSNSRSSSSEI